MKYSVVIPSHNRKEELQKCIKSIEDAYEFAKKVEIEILVVFCGFNYDKSSFNFKYPEITTTHYLEQNIVCRAKNIGIEKATGDYIVLIDDDATLKKDFFIVLNNVISSKIKAFGAKLQDPHTYECFTKSEDKLKTKQLGRLDYNLFRGSALIIEKNILKDAGLFDENFGPGGMYFSAEESDLFFRIKMMGEDVLFVPELIVYHPTGGILSETKAFNYSYATGSVLTKYCFKDFANAHYYLYLILRIYLICTVRIVQMVLIPRTMVLKNQRHRYFSVIKGITVGILQYSKKIFFTYTKNQTAVW